MSVAVELFDPRSTLSGSPARGSWRGWTSTLSPLQIVVFPSLLCTDAEPSITTVPLVVSGLPGGVGNASTVVPSMRMVRVAVRSSLKQRCRVANAVAVRIENGVEDAIVVLVPRAAPANIRNGDA